jgi:hypothetical protein
LPRAVLLERIQPMIPWPIPDGTILASPSLKEVFVSHGVEASNQKFGA